MLNERIEAFHILGEKIRNLTDVELNDLAWRVENNNSWFTLEQTKNAIAGLQLFLDREKISNWLKPYKLNEPEQPKSVGILMAGNIPAVGFHDLMTVLLTGHRACVKLSASDQVLIKWLVEELIKISPEFNEKVVVEEMLKAKDAYIATGSDNSARYFNYYFGKYPNIIRKNRTSVAILNGQETEEDLMELGRDIFQYFGLGCRNVSKLYVNGKAQLITFLDAIQEFQALGDHHKYRNNYDYNKSIYLVNREDHLDNGFLLLKESLELVSPIAVLYYEIYEDEGHLQEILADKNEKIQCIVSKKGWFGNSIDFGQAQCPALDDFADGVDTVEFLKNL